MARDGAKYDSADTSVQRGDSLLAGDGVQGVPHTPVCRLLERLQPRLDRVHRVHAHMLRHTGGGTGDKVQRSGETRAVSHKLLYMEDEMSIASSLSISWPSAAVHLAGLNLSLPCARPDAADTTTANDTAACTAAVVGAV